jgi:hypothetical protein
MFFPEELTGDMGMHHAFYSLLGLNTSLLAAY